MYVRTVEAVDRTDFDAKVTRNVLVALVSEETSNDALQNAAEAV